MLYSFLLLLIRPYELLMVSRGISTFSEKSWKFPTKYFQNFTTFLIFDIFWWSKKNVLQYQCCRLRHSERCFLTSNPPEESQKCRDTIRTLENHIKKNKLYRYDMGFWAFRYRFCGPDEPLRVFMFEKYDSNHQSQKKKSFIMLMRPQGKYTDTRQSCRNAQRDPIAWIVTNSNGCCTHLQTAREMYGRNIAHFFRSSLHLYFTCCCF